jgi:hypothetical protein
VQAALVERRPFLVPEPALPPELQAPQQPTRLQAMSLEQ